MLKDERLERLEGFINANRFVTLAELTANFPVSRATIRRDLDQLGKEQRIGLTRGGAFAINRQTSANQLQIPEKQQGNDEESRIARCAAQYILEDETIFIDNGKAGFCMTEHMNGKKSVTAATNNLLTAAELAVYPNLSLIMIGGSIHNGGYMSTGYFASMHVANYHFDKTFLCPDAINLSHGCMVANVEEIAVKRTLIQSSDEIIVICDHTKFQARAFISICPIGRVTKVITGTELDRDIYDDFTAQGISVVQV